MRRNLMVLAALTMILAAGLVEHRAEASAAPQILTGILNKMERAHQNLKSLKAELVQQKTNTQIGITDSEYGQMIYKPNSGREKGKLRIDYVKPSKDIIALVGEQVIYYQPRINQVFKSTIARASKGKIGGYAQLVGLDGSVKSLAGSYNIEFIRDEQINGQMTTLLRLAPKTGSQFTSIELWVNQQSWLPAQWKMYEKNGDHTIVTLRNTQINAAIPDAAFNVKIPGGTKVVDKI
ncbi:MAG: outer membrane lipoprotein carrier protein LolA [Acidobacteriota bacterium]|nr:MAG: outer membrane lipoprotein carrier protein LolA [Acidobacteriota bacterium]